MTIVQIQRELTNRVNEARRLLRLSQTDEFEYAYSLKHPDETVPLENIEDWMEKKLAKDVDSLTLRQLRVLAAKLGVPKYSVWSKGTLASKVRHALKAQEIARTSSHPEGQSTVGVGGLGQSPVLHKSS